MVVGHSVMRVCLLLSMGVLLGLVFGGPGSAMASTIKLRLGPVYGIAEPDFLEDLQKRLADMRKDGSLKALERQAISRSRESIENPKHIDLPRAQNARSWTYDPTYIVPQDLTDQKGQVFAQAGQRINPLELGTSLNHPLVFVDASDAEQRGAIPALLQVWPEAKLILTGGKWAEVSKSLKRQVFYDQGGTLVRTFGISAVPAVVFQKEGEHVLRVQELPL